MLNELISTDIYLLRFKKDTMKPYSSSIGDILLGMVLFSRKNIGSLGSVEKFQYVCENMQGSFSTLELELFNAGFHKVCFWYYCYACSQTYSKLFPHCLSLLPLLTS